MTMINFNEAPVCGTELDHIRNAIADRHICGDGTFTKQCNKFLEGYTYEFLYGSLGNVSFAT